MLHDLAQYGFLGGIVGIAGLFLGAGTAIMFGWTRKLNTWKPPEDVLPDALGRVVTMLCAVGIFVAWLLAEPANQPAYVQWVIRLAVTAAVAFLVYVGLRTYCGRFRKQLVGPDNLPGPFEVVWGGFWLTPRARKAVASGDVTVEQFLAGNNFAREQVWTPLSLTLSAIAASLVLLVALVSGTAAISTASTAAQVALTNKPAREVFSSSDVRGLPPSPAPKPAEP